MKLFLIASSLLASTCYGFTPQSISFGTRRSDAFIFQATSNEEAIEEALRISKEKGASSQEARVAWDIVEELNASDNSAAFTGGVGDDAVVDTIASLKDSKPDDKSPKNMVESVRPIHLSSGSSSEGDSPEVTAMLQSALENAKKLTEEFGITSSEAKLAWEDVEEIASSGTSQATKEPLNSDECLVEKLEACEALEELDRAILLESNKDKGRYQG